MKSDDKIKDVRRQINSMRSGVRGSRFIVCPFCRKRSTPAQGALCCELLAKTVNAILSDIEFHEAKRLAENVSARIHEVKKRPLVRL